jgi:hypothetical protein
MYLGLKQPWRTTTPSVAITVDAPHAPIDGAPAKPAKRPGRNRGRTPAGSPDVGEQNSTDETAPPVLTAADRGLLWNGADFGLPTKAIDMGANGDEGRPLSDSEINAGLRGAGILECVVQTASGTDLQATITVKLLVDGTGRVSKHRVQAPRYLHDHGLPSCVAKAVARARFAATGAATLVTAPFVLGS